MTAEQARVAALPNTVSGREWPGVCYFSTTRQGGVSQPPYDSMNLGLHTGDNIQAVLQNRQRLQSVLPAPIVWLEQVHGVDVYDADLDHAFLSDSPVRADAAITTSTNKVLAVMTADCLPVVLASARGDVIGVAHAGWRGLLNGVLENTLRQMREKTAVNDFYAWIGPAIGFDAFEVGQEVYDAFIKNDEKQALYFRTHPEKAGKWFANLSAMAAYRLRKNDVSTIEESKLCTYANEWQFFSYRRNAQTGRMVTVVWIAKPAA